MSDILLSQVGVVVIGRNEGERLRVCVASIIKFVQSVVYVDSGSTDASIDIARSLNVTVVELDMSIPFTAARARNEGFRRLLEMSPKVRHVQFVDGDCEIVPGWMESAVAFLDAHEDVATTCGRRRERFPERSVYNRLCDIEWDTPVGEARACGGDAMYRTEAFLQVSGFCDGLIAGEEPELCVRLRQRGWKIWRLDKEMTLHDAAMIRFMQWWKRSVRAGHAYAEGVFIHGRPPEKHYVRESRRSWIWGGLIPSLIAIASIWSGWALVLFMLYPIQMFRLFLIGDRSSRENCLRAFFLVLGKFPEAVGQMQFVVRKLTGARARLIEYK
jgi:glycosyltransferase involved in cell wall biosynthesis